MIVNVIISGGFAGTVYEAVAILMVVRCVTGTRFAAVRSVDKRRAGVHGDGHVADLDVVGRVDVENDLVARADERTDNR